MCVARLNQTPLIEQLQQEKKVKFTFTLFSIYFSSIFLVSPKKMRSLKSIQFCSNFNTLNNKPHRNQAVKEKAGALERQRHMTGG